jgi:1-acyl-sn-glycerol-3-phosphate acyltransferase
MPLVIAATIGMAVASLAASLFDATGNTQHRLARVWSRMLLRVGFVRVETEGLEKLDPKLSYVLVANHSSYYDTPVILANIPLQFRFFAKKGLFQIPLMGHHMSRAGYFPVVRDDPRASLKSMLEGARQIREKGISVLLFPEGGRSLTTLREFKEGAAHIAIKAGVPVVPVGLIGVRRILPMHSLVLMPGTVKLCIGDPISTAALGSRDRALVTQLAMESIAQMIGEPLPVPAK